MGGFLVPGVHPLLLFLQRGDVMKLSGSMPRRSEPESWPSRSRPPACLRRPFVPLPLFPFLPPPLPPCSSASLSPPSRAGCWA